MSTLEKTIHLLSNLPESQLEIIYSFVQFLDSKKENIIRKEESLEVILGNITGVLQDSGKSLEEYRNERIKDRYENFD